MDFESMNNEIREKGINIIRYFLYDKGNISGNEFIKTYPLSNCYSIAKAFTATAIGILYDMGKIDSDDYVADILEYENDLKKMKIRHLLTHTPGFTEGCMFGDDRFAHGDDLLQYALSRPMAYEPGTTLVYSNSSTYILSCIVGKISGVSLDLFLKEHLLSKIGIKVYAWDSCPGEQTVGATGFYISTFDLLLFGILYLNRGVWNGERILSEKWIKMASSGFGFWRNSDEFYYAKGAYAQNLFIVPDKNIVFANHAFDNDKTDELDEIIRKHLNIK